MFLLLFFANWGLAQEKNLLSAKEAAQKEYSKYRTRPGDTISKLLRKLNLYPLWEDDGYLKKVIAINAKNKTESELHKLDSGVDIYLPIVNNHPDYKYDGNGYLIIPGTGEVVRLPATTENTTQLENLSFYYPCQNYLDPGVYNALEKIIDKQSGKIKKIEVDFRCGDGSGVKPYSVFPWMHSFDETRNVASDEKQAVAEEKTYYFFPYIGLGDVKYKEGAFTTGFEHMYLGLQYRQILPIENWHVDTAASYTINNKSSDYDGADPKLLDIDFRLGKSIHLLDEPWHFTLFAGAYYTQMFVTDDLFGYKGTYYAQIYPELRRVFKSGNALTFYLKYVPTTDEFLSLSSGERSIEYGLSYFYRAELMPLVFKLNYLDFQFNSEKTNTDVKIEQFNISIGTGF